MCGLPNIRCSYYQEAIPNANSKRAIGKAWTFFTTLDMMEVYYQIPLHEDGKKFTEFITPQGLFEFNVMPFGILNASMVFQEMII